MDRENYIEALRAELVETVAAHMTPVAERYGYSEVPLETHIKWRPLVLVLGNYSSGKSTLINEFLGGEVQATGQAPTDDSFTILTWDESEERPERGGARVTDERDGKVLLGDPQFPFETLRKHGARFSSHFRLKRVNSPFLRQLSLIDTPGMLDSITERDRGYDYQEVIGDLAAMADLVLVLFDPHKAGTVREAYASLRETLPTKTFEDRVIFVLNRIDECSSLNDLLRVYGTLCWNLSQMTGRKDIPMIRLTYSANAAFGRDAPKDVEDPRGYLRYLDNQRDDLRRQIERAPRHRLDHLASYVETHGERLGQLLEALVNYRKQKSRFKTKLTVVGVMLAVLAAGAAGFATWSGMVLPETEPVVAYGVGAAAAVVVLLLWVVMVWPYAVGAFHRNRLASLDQLIPLETQSRRDSWNAVRDHVYRYLKKTGGKYSLSAVRREYQGLEKQWRKSAEEIREALAEISDWKKPEDSSTAPGLADNKASRSFS